MNVWPDDPPDPEDDEPVIPFHDLYAREVWVTDNPVVGILLGPDGGVLLEVRERPPLGFV